ncbi:MAG: hypothetical protein CVU34_02435 [Betaproteobacteria bacterium HGW-Betaproteobacteria-7]|jgi:hypothetical protein|nr:MAG: hypothetical protein CVU34_02435 [Betaproteobacteria bacterium HGW-Betaproteobacteria-7]
MKKMLAIAALLSASTFAQANLVVNGSFEDYSSIKPGQWSIFGSGYGWTTGPRGVEIRNAAVGTAADGVRFAELDTTANSWISQIIHTNAHQTLELSFAYAPRSGVAANSNGIDVFWNSLLLASITGNGGAAWLDHVFDVQADANGLGVLKFAATGISDSLGGSLDNISVTAVPEPETLAMLLTGLGILAAVNRRRKSRI